MSSTSPTVRMPRHPGTHSLFPLAGLLAVLVAIAIAATVVVQSRTTPVLTGGTGTQPVTVDDRWSAKWAHATGIALATGGFPAVQAAIRQADRFNDRMAALGIGIRMDPFSGALHGGLAREPVRLVLPYLDTDRQAAMIHRLTARAIEAKRG